MGKAVTEKRTLEEGQAARVMTLEFTPRITANR